MTGLIIGSDFLSFYNLLVDVRHRRLIDNITILTVNGDAVGTSGGQIEVPAGSSRYHTTLLDFPEIIRPAGLPRKPGTLLYTTSGPRLNNQSLRARGG